MIQHIKAFIESTFRCRIYRFTAPRGTDLYLDLNREFGLQNFRTVFDIGANVGQTAVIYLKEFPAANIYSFEPVAATFQELQKVAASHSRLQTFQCGFGDARGRVAINVGADSKTNSILHSRAEDHSEEIEIETVANFCQEHKIETVDFIKIDTEGYELKVLEGCRSLLEQRRLKMILVESAPLQTDGFVPFAAVVEFLSTFGYELFGIYEQQPHWYGKRSIMYFNLVFVCSDLTKHESKL